MSRMPRHILVTGVGAPPGLGLMRSLRDCPLALTLTGADISPFAAGLHEPGCSALVLPRADTPHYVDAVLEACRLHEIDTVIPCSEAELDILAREKPRFAAASIQLPIADPEVMAFGIDKALLLERAAATGLPHPRTLAPQSEAELANWKGRFPCVIKPARSRGARGVSYPADALDLRKAWRQTTAEHGPCLVQDYIPGGTDTVYTIGSLWQEGRLIASSLHRKLATNPPSGGVAIAGETAIDPDILDAGLAVLHATGPWHGLTAVEVKCPAPGEAAQLLEINPRMWGFGYLMTLAGLNLPELLVRMLAGEFDQADPDPDQLRYSPLRVVRSWEDRFMRPESGLEKVS